MNTLLFSGTISMLALAVHWLVWRIAIPRRQTRALLATFAIVLIVLFVVLLLVPKSVPGWRPTSAWEWLHVGTFYVAVTLAYVVVYSALEERSPSMTLLSYVASAPETGRSRRELEAVLGSASPVEIRLDALVRDRMVDEQQGFCRLTDKGSRWAATFEGARRFLGFGKGG